jgi:hypothetical protein
MKAGAPERDPVVAQLAWSEGADAAPLERGTRTHSVALMAGPLRAAKSGLSWAFVFGDEVGVISRPGRLWSVCDHAVISGLRGSRFPAVQGNPRLP